MAYPNESCHKDCYCFSLSPDIIHRDVKTNNILLDNSFCVEVADFGLSRLFPNDVTHVSTAPQGTPGYVDPEYHRCYQLTNKSDVYSFGVVLIELISSIPPIYLTRHKDEINLADLAIRKIKKSATAELVDPFLGFESNSDVKRQVTCVAELAFQCLQRDKELRPSMDEVLEVLRRSESPKDIDEPGHVEEVKVHGECSLSPPSPDHDEVKLLRNVKYVSDFYSNPYPESASIYSGVPVFTFKDLEIATKCFDSSRELGEGGFGIVYYGKLQDGREVAVKRLYENNYRRVEQFMNEIKILMNLRHTNLVSLYGSTSRHSRELLLVYEYISNGTVASHLHHYGSTNTGFLPWPIRMKVAIETATALAYLHASDIIHHLAIRKIQKSALAELVNPSLGYDSNSDVKRQITSVAELAFQCLQRDRELRPSMDEVLEVLRRIGSQKDDLEEVKVYGEGPLSPSLPDHDQIGPSSIKVQKFEMQRFATIVYFTDHHLRNLLQSDSCEIFSYNITLPPSSPLGYFTINNNITLFKCNRTLQVNTPKTFLKNTSCGYDIFMGPPHSDDVSQGSLAACSMVQLPMNGFAVSANPFAFLTAEISVQFLPSDECMECHHYRGHCHLDSQRKVNCAQRYISNS
ncbi:hypothetical protein JHK86_056007 [Glycine max]|nr:hypothetical protein JHK86_056007 [Glycine max]